MPDPYEDMIATGETYTAVGGSGANCREVAGGRGRMSCGGGGGALL